MALFGSSVFLRGYMRDLLGENLERTSRSEWCTYKGIQTLKSKESSRLYEVVAPIMFGMWVF
ncbi:hypothetical protein HN51_035563, partial [Arachis hypogaea]